MFVEREDNPDKKEWIDECYGNPQGFHVIRQKNGDYLVYLGRKKLIKAESYEEAMKYIEPHHGD